jgi:hypothetical protein
VCLHDRHLTDGPALRSARDHHVTFIAETAAGPALYAMAGTTATGGANLQMERAAIGADGALSDWEGLGRLSEGRIGPGLAQDGTSLVVAGGLLADNNSTAATWVVHVDDDGGLTVTDGPAMATTRYHVGLAMAQGFVYATGGLNQVYADTVSQEVLTSVERAPFDGTTLGEWEAVGDLPVPTTHHAIVAYDDALYVIGGGDGVSARTTILRATVGSDGALGEWVEAGALPEGRATSAATVFLDQLFVVAGMTSLTGGEVDTVLRASFAEDGTVGEFEELAPLPIQRAHSHQAPTYGAVMYSVGGSIMHEPQDGVYLGTLY